VIFFIYSQYHGSRLIVNAASLNGGFGHPGPMNEREGEEGNAYGAIEA
jgi:hypothetical protein